MSLRHVLTQKMDHQLADGVCALWADVVNAGGAVGFVPPVTTDDIRPELLRYLDSMAEERVRLLVGFDERGEVAATAFFAFNTHRLMRHWVWLYTVMVRPSLQGSGAGRELMTAAEKAARDMDGVEGIRLTLRSGLGLERFYGACGYQEVGRVPGAIRVGEDSFRDDVTMWLALS
ncbi:GNAT family N-acetyltransferase [Streptomyces sp. N2-109]|uniref:GNAT family N-acetyltransferase n=1 Tax=Streptomyces gossypii TaxID=2883101 RepID=A0ABT2JW14_9ACTN|nr:GNAT family N-acetyltransferase [Streptomyces gossypii]MCT2592107.1 GNAT family N-acetyltransferase [Streptomyces gossypii]